MSQELPDAATELLRMPLSTTQRLELISELWDSIPDSVEGFPVPEWHAKELDRRLKNADEDPGAAISWREVERRLHEK